MKHAGRKTIGVQLMLAARLHRARTAALLGGTGLFAGQEQALQILARHKADMTMSDLARALRVRPPTASKTVARLAAQNLVAREAHASDGRVVHVRLTPAGIEKLARIDAATEEIEAEIAALFDIKELKRLRKGLRRIARKLGESAGAEAEPDLAEDDEAEDVE